MKRAYLSVTLLLIAAVSFAQDRKTGRTAPRNIDMQWQRNDKYSLMDNTRQLPKLRDSLQVGDIRSATIATPRIRTYHFNKDKYCVPVQKKN